MKHIIMSREKYHELLIARLERQLDAEERNAPCRCGSGRKTKKCLRTHEAELRDLAHEEALLCNFPRDRSRMRASTVVALASIAMLPPR